MILKPEVAELLTAAATPGAFTPDTTTLSLADVLKPWQEISNADVGIVGVPFDTSVMARPGCRFGPSAIRNAMALSSTYEVGLDVDISEGVTITDFGNIDCVHTNVLETHRRIEAVVTDIMSNGVTPVVLGGDHGTSYPTIKSLINNTEGNIGVIMFDGHMDLRTDHHGEISSGTPFRRLMEEPAERPLNPKNLVEVGINGWLNSKVYRDFAREQGVTIIPARDVHRRGIDDVIVEALEKAGDGTDAIWISFDIDGVELAHAPGTCAPNPGGLTAYEALEAVWQIARSPKCRGFDILEVSPPLDVQGLTAITASQLALNFIGATKVRLQESAALTITD